VWDARTGEPVTAPLQLGAEVWAAAFSPDGTRVVTASADGTARVWDAGTGQPVTAPLEHGDAVVAVAFSPDGTFVATASWDKTARVWDAGTGQPVTAPLEHGAGVSAAAFSPDGTRVVTASKNTGRVWELPLDRSSLEDWQRRARCGPFALENGVLVANHSPCP
jgi:eukaryotic-like serine/threonine-protein kinase